MPESTNAGGAENSIRLLRPVFTPAQYHQAGMIDPVPQAERARRRHVVTHAIDNVLPEVGSDRDDGIFVDINPNGDGYRLHITISDVAAHIPLGTPLADAARDRAFTVYRHPFIDHMFPSQTIDRMSLEHGSERLGLMVTIDMDGAFKPKHTQFERVVCHPDNAEYAQANNRMLHDPQFMRMERVATGIRQNVFGGDAAVEHELKAKGKWIENLTAEKLEAMRCVETYMLLANNAVAEFCQKADLTLLYRNFDGSYIGPAGTERAYYSPDLTEHSALEKMGVKGAYCHFTSPIRRAPDYFNAHQIHHVIDVMERVQAIFTSSSADDTLETKLWGNAPAIINAMHRGEFAIRTELTILAHKMHFPAEDGFLLDTLAHELAQMSPPLSTQQLSAIAQQINPLNDAERHLVNSPEMRLQRKIAEDIPYISRFNKEILHHTGPNDFSNLLMRCARSGVLPECVYESALHRLEHDPLVNLARDALQVIFRARYPEEERWRELKKIVDNKIRNQPGIINNIIELAEIEGLMEKGARQEVMRTIPIPGHEIFHSGRDRLRAALVTLRGEDGTIYSAPWVSIGDSDRAALSHARYSFLNRYSFGELKPEYLTKIPNLFYAQLEGGGMARDVVMDHILESIGAAWNITYSQNGLGSTRARIEVKLPGQDEPINVMGNGQNAQVARDKAITRLLRRDAFKEATATMRMSDLSVWPEANLLHRIHQLDCRAEFKTEELPRRHGFKVTVTLMGEQGGLFKFAGEGPNIERARNNACTLALRELNMKTEEQDRGETKEDSHRPFQGWGHVALQEAQEKSLGKTTRRV